MTSARVVHVVLPDGVDDASRPSGGNVYDRRVCEALEAAGWAVHEHPVHGTWPWPDEASVQSLRAVLAAVPRGAAVLVDGLVGSSAPQALAAEDRRLRLVLLIHMPVADGAPADRAGQAESREAAALAAAAAVVTTSVWARSRLVDGYGVDPARVHVAEPGVDPERIVVGSAEGTALICVAVVAPHKGQDVLLAALARVQDEAWRCTLVGSLEHDAGFVARLRDQAEADGIGSRVAFSGPLVGDRLAAAYADADLLVLPSRGETYGMVVAEALARGIPVVASDVGGVADTLGRARDGTRPGLLVPPGDPAALATTLRRWLGDPSLRQELRTAAQSCRPSFATWQATAERVAAVLVHVTAGSAA